MFREGGERVMWLNHEMMRIDLSKALCARA